MERNGREKKGKECNGKVERGGKRETSHTQTYCLSYTVSE